MAFLSIIPPSGQVIDENGVLRVAQRTFVDATALGLTEVVPAQGAGVRVRVLGTTVISLTELTVRFKSSTTNISSAKPLAARGGWVAPQAETGWFQTAANEALNIDLSAAGNVGVDVIWVQAG